MLIKQKSNRRKILLITSVLLASAIVAVLAYFAYASRNESSPIGIFGTTDKGTDDSGEKDSSEKNSNPTPDDKITPSNSDQAIASPVDESTGKQTVPMVASANVDGSTLYIRGGLNVPRSNGSCFAMLNGPQGEKVKKETILMPGASTTDCRTIQIPTSELTPGKWTFTLNYSADDATGASDVSSFNI